MPNPMTQPLTVNVRVRHIMVAGSIAPIFDGGDLNAGQVVGAITVDTTPASSPFAGTLALSGADAAKFALSSPRLPSNLLIGVGNLPDATYSIAIIATP